MGRHTHSSGLSQHLSVLSMSRYLEARASTTTTAGAASAACRIATTPTADPMDSEEQAQPASACQQ